MTAELHPLAGEDLCECGHKHALHISLLAHDHDGCCQVGRCLCECFIPEARDA